MRGNSILKAPLYKEGGGEWLRLCLAADIGFSIGRISVWIWSTCEKHRPETMERLPPVHATLQSQLFETIDNSRALDPYSAMMATV
jgi:hypothetical protein